MVVNLSTGEILPATETELETSNVGRIEMIIGVDSDLGWFTRVFDYARMDYISYEWHETETEARGVFASLVA